MDSFLDIAPVTDFADINGKRVELYGISARSFATLFTRYPEIYALVNKKRKTLSAKDVITIVPDAISAIIAAGAGHLNNKKAEAIADKLSIGDQVTMLSKILRMTLPKGVGPFVEEVEEIATLMDHETTPQMSQGTNSQEQLAIS